MPKRLRIAFYGCVVALLSFSCVKHSCEYNKTANKDWTEKLQNALGGFSLEIPHDYTLWHADSSTAEFRRHTYAVRAVNDTSDFAVLHKTIFIYQDGFNDACGAKNKFDADFKYLSSDQTQYVFDDAPKYAFLQGNYYYTVTSSIKQKDSLVERIFNKLINAVIGDQAENGSAYRRHAYQKPVIE